jgi:hypothetical protein
LCPLPRSAYGPWGATSRHECRGNIANTTRASRWVLWLEALLVTAWSITEGTAPDMAVGQSCDQLHPRSFTLCTLVSPGQQYTIQYAVMTDDCPKMMQNRQADMERRGPLRNPPALCFRVRGLPDKYKARGLVARTWPTWLRDSYERHTPPMPRRYINFGSLSSQRSLDR